MERRVRDACRDKWKDSVVPVQATVRFEEVLSVLKKAWSGSHDLLVPTSVNWGRHYVSYRRYIAVKREEISSLETVASQIETYHRERSGDKPLSFLVLGEPGSGKSFAVKEVAKEAVGDDKTLEIIEANVAQFAGEDDLYAVFEKARSACLRGNLPLVFLDECDAHRHKDPFGWLKTFLGPMQDGTYWTREGERPLGKVILAFAGGRIKRDWLKRKEENGGKEEWRSFRDAKGPDFASRVRVVLEIEGPEAKSWSRAVLVDNLLRKVWPDLRVVEGEVLARLCEAELRHGARSLETLIRACRLEEKRRLSPGSLPPKNVWDLHTKARSPQKVRFGHILLGGVLLWGLFHT